MKIKLPGFFKGQIKNKKLRVFLKVFLSLCIFYHLAMIFIIPHRMSMVYERLMPYFSSYANTLALNTTWDFYAPNPSHYYYFEYAVIDLRDKVSTFRWPPSRVESKRIYLNHNRLIYHSRFFMILGKQPIRKHFLPYLCSLHPEATEITIKAILEDRPHFKKAKVFRPRFFSANNEQNMKIWFSTSARCKKRGKLRNIDSHDSFEEENHIWENEYSIEMERTNDEMDKK